MGVYRDTAGFPSNELYGMTSQLRRAASSIPTNIAEGCGRDGDAELTRFLQIAMGSASELEYHILLASELNLFQPRESERLTKQVTEVKRMLATLIAKLRRPR